MLLLLLPDLEGGPWRCGAVFVCCGDLRLILEELLGFFSHGDTDRSLSPLLDRSTFLALRGSPTSEDSVSFLVLMGGDLPDLLRPDSGLRLEDDLISGTGEADLRFWTFLFLFGEGDFRLFGGVRHFLFLFWDGEGPSDSSESSLSDPEDDSSFSSTGVGLFFCTGSFILEICTLRGGGDGSPSDSDDELSPEPDFIESFLCLTGGGEASGERKRFFGFGEGDRDTCLLGGGEGPLFAGDVEGLRRLGDTERLHLKNRIGHKTMS